MDRNRIGCLLVAALALGVSTARADDWPQFRRDERRTAASPDHLQFPLTDIWSARGYGLVTREGRAYYLGTDLEKNALVCADLRTGVTLWTRTLPSFWRKPLLQDRRGPIAVSPDGIVFVQDAIPAALTRASFSPTTGPRITQALPRSPEYSLLAFRAADGTPVKRFPELDKRLRVSQLRLGDGPGADRVGPIEVESQPLGPFLLRGNEVTAASLRDSIWSWTPGSPGRIVALAHLAEPQPSLVQAIVGDLRGLEALPGKQFGWVTAACPSGIVVGAGFGPKGALPERQTLAVVSGDRCAWHRDYSWGLGMPVVDQGLILTGAGGGNGMQAIIAHDSGNGGVRWTFAPQGLGADRGQSGDAASLAADSNAHLTNPGLVVNAGRVYGVAAGAIVALAVKSGEPVWSQPLGAGERVTTLVASADHLLAGIRSSDGKEAQERIVALRLDSGKAEWGLSLPQAGVLALSDGLLFSTDTDVHCLAPAERTFHVAVDSPRREEYVTLVAPLTDDKERAAPGVADASVLRLNWGEPVDDLVRKAKERRALLPNSPLLISVDWLDATRTSIRGSQTGWDEKETAAFTRLCERLAAEVAPEHFDVAPEVNVYLVRDVRRLDAVRALVRAAAAAVHRGCPTTRVVASFNREVMGGYGSGSYLPFGELKLPKKTQLSELLSLFEDVDEVGLTSCPQSAFTSPTDLPGDYFLSLKPLFQKKPLLFTRLGVNYDATSKIAEVEQASYLRHLIQGCYWLDAKLIAYPDHSRPETKAAPTGAPPPDLALRAGDQERLSLAMWRDLVYWRRVTRLTAAAAKLDMPKR